MKHFKWLIIVLILLMGVAAGCTTEPDTSNIEPEPQEEISNEESETAEEESVEEQAVDNETEGEESEEEEQEEVTADEAPEIQEDTSDDDSATSAGRDLAETRCTECHGLGKVESATKDQDGWTNTVNRMISKGASLDDNEKNTLIDYLVENYGK